MKENQLKKSLSTVKGYHWHDWLGACHLSSAVVGLGSAMEIKNKFHFLHPETFVNSQKNHPWSLTKIFKVRHWQVLDSPKSLQLLFSRKETAVKHWLLTPIQELKELKSVKRQILEMHLTYGSVFFPGKKTKPWAKRWPHSKGIYSSPASALPWAHGENLLSSMAPALASFLTSVENKGNR